MPNTKTLFVTGSTRARQVGRVGGLTRWARRTTDERHASMAQVRAGIIEKYRAEALKYAPEGATPEQVDEMAHRLWYADKVRQAVRMTEARLAKRAAKSDPWAQSNG